MISMGMKLKSLRKQHGLTQLDASIIIGCERQAISQYESDKNRPSREKLEKLAQLYNVSVEYLKYDSNNLGALLEYRLQEEFNIGELGEWEKKYLVEKMIKIYDIIK